MKILNKMSGTVTMQVFSADPMAMLRALNGSGLKLFDIESISPFRFRLVFERKFLKVALGILEARGERVELIRVKGLIPRIEKLAGRPVLVISCLLLFLLTFLLPTRVLFVAVTGNEKIPAPLIVEKAEELGLGFRAKRRDVRSERFKNELLYAVPQLEWVGVNTKGCIATVHVQEKADDDVNPREVPEVCSIVASRNGIILDCTVTSGTGTCNVGQAVQKGDVLVSGYSVGEDIVTATRAEGEIIAQTVRHIQMQHPVDAIKRGESQRQHTRYSLLIGKKLINFYKDSGICDAGCAKIYNQHYISLPGGFQLPLALVSETWTIFENSDVVCCMNEPSWIGPAAEEYLIAQMVAGRILCSDVSVSATEDVCKLVGEYTCIEMIGQIMSEESLPDYGEHYREDR